MSQTTAAVHFFLQHRVVAIDAPPHDKFLYQGMRHGAWSMKAFSARDAGPRNFKFDRFRGTGKL